MMQNTAKAIQERFIMDVNILKLRFPLASIVEKTGEDKGNVSKYLNKKLVPPETFLKKFYESFGLIMPPEMYSTPNISNRSGFNYSGTDEKERLILSQQETIDDLRETINFLKERISWLEANQKRN
jgi:hypothetical protein